MGNPVYYFYIVTSMTCFIKELLPYEAGTFITNAANAPSHEVNLVEPVPEDLLRVDSSGESHLGHAGHDGAHKFILTRETLNEKASAVAKQRWEFIKEKR